MIDMGAFSSIAERTVSSKEEQDRAFARDRERMQRYLAELNSKENQQ
tara:strand:+ start:1435 stop:1575 length:141 start_codon:yes stop_codon:yes gene_type:complete